MGMTKNFNCREAGFLPVDYLQRSMLYDRRIFSR